MQQQNYRKSASDVRKSRQLVSVTAEWGSSERQKLLESDILRNDEIQLIKYVKSESHIGQISGKTEADTYLVFVLEARDKGQKVKETDICPLLEVSTIADAGEIRELSKKNPKLFYLPLMVCHNDKWLQHIPNFHSWLVSSCYFPDLAEDGKTLLRSTGTKTASELDTFRVYTTAIYATLQKFWATGSPDTARHVLLLAHTLKHLKTTFIKPIESDISKKLVECDTLERLMKNRDNSVEDAKEYIRWEMNHHPADYYWCLFNLVCNHTRQQVVGLWNLVLGVMSQDILGEYGATCDGLADHWLRLVWERISPCIPVVNFEDCFTESELIKSVHEKSGKKAENYVKIWAFVLNIVKNLLCNKFYVLLNSTKAERAISEMIRIREEFKSLNGITTSSLAISPTLEHCLTEKCMSEVILTASVRNRKTQDLLDVAALFDSYAKTPNTERILSKNIKRAAYIRDITSKSSFAQIGNIFDPFQPPSVSHYFTSNNTLNFICAMVNLVNQEEKVEIQELWLDQIFFMIKKADLSGVLGYRRSMSLLNHFATKHSIIRKKYTLPVLDVYVANNTNLWNAQFKYASSLHTSGLFEPLRVHTINSNVNNNNNNNNSTLAIEDEEFKDEDPVEPSQYVPIKDAIIRIQEMKREMEKINAQIDNTCPVCLCEYLLETGKQHPSHDDKHPVCEMCFESVVRKFKSCVICRTEI